MSLARTILVSTALVTIAVGCGSSSEQQPATRTISGKLATGGTTSPRAFGGVSVANGGAGLHVVAYQLVKKGERGARIDVPVTTDGRFSIDVSRGARYFIAIEAAGGQNSVLLNAGAGGNVFDVRADGSSGAVDVGSVKVVGGQARTSVTLGASSGIALSKALSDEVYQAYDGALKSAQAAVDEARKATEAACADAKKALDDAQKQCTAAGVDCGIAQTRADADATCADANATLNDADQAIGDARK